MLKKFLHLFYFFHVCASLSAKLPDLDSQKVIEKVNEILEAHALHQEFTPQLMERTLCNYIEELDPTKLYFIQSDIEHYIKPDPEFIASLLKEYNQASFSEFFKIHDIMVQAVARRKLLESQMDLKDLPKHVKSSEFKDMTWTNTENDLKMRLKRVRALQIETFSKFSEEDREKCFQRIQKNQQKFEERILTNNTPQHPAFILSNILKAIASSFDAHTSYFTPAEAEQFMIHFQMRLFGIGALLKDDLNGFTITKIIEGGPAARGQDLKVKDRIVAVNGEPVVGMDFVDAIELIRGPENSQVELTVVRLNEDAEEKQEETLTLKITRGEVVFNEARHEASYEPYGSGVIGYLRLHTFYQDPEHSSAEDLTKEIEKLKKEHQLKGLILDLRYNTGGILSQAVGVTGLFIKKGIVVGIKDNKGKIQYLRDFNANMAWDGPLIVLVNKVSASASEIVAQTLQDYGRAIIVGDETTYGKGSFQTFTLNSSADAKVNSQGEYKVTRGCYYTPSGKTPQLVGVKTDVLLPGPLSQIDFGERFAKYPLENTSIPSNLEDDLSDIPFFQRLRMETFYKFDLQKKLDVYTTHIPTLQKNAKYRIENNKNYQSFLKELKKKDSIETEAEEPFGQNDLQLAETYNLMKDLLVLLESSTSN